MLRGFRIKLADGLLLDVPAKEPRDEILGKGRRWGRPKRRTPQGAKTGMPSSALDREAIEETRWLTAEKNLSALANLSGKWIDSVHGRRPPRGILLDMDSSVSPTHGEQENSVWNGHCARTCYHPLFVFNQFGDLERCALRPGNVHSADRWDGVLKPVVGAVSRQGLAH